MRRILALAVVAVVAVVAGVVLVLGLAQLFLPGIAAQRLRDRLSRSGTVLKVEVAAFPAIELLWHQADRVVVKLAQYRSGAASLASLLAEAGDVGSLDASAARLDTGLLTLRDASLRKRGSALTGSATITESDLRRAVPFLDSVQPVAAGDGQLTLRGTATLLGVTASVDATVATQNGSLVVQPDVPFGGLATVTVFSNPHVEVQGISAKTTAAGFSVAAFGRLR